MDAPLDRERRSTLAELGRDVVLEDEEGTIYFQTLHADTGKAISLSITHTTINLEMYKDGHGMHSESFPFQHLKSWEARKDARSSKKKEGKEEDDERVLFLDFGDHREPPTITLRTPDADKVAGLIRGKIEALIAEKREKGEVVPPLGGAAQGGQSFSEEFTKEFLTIYGSMLRSKWLKLVSAIATTIISDIIMFGVSVLGHEKPHALLTDCASFSLWWPLLSLLGSLGMSKHTLCLLCCKH